MPLPGWGVPPVGGGLTPARRPLGRVRDAAIGRAMTALFDRGLPALNAARLEVGLEPLDAVLGQVARVDRLLILTTRAFEDPSFSGPDVVLFVGPRNDDPAWSAPWTPLPGDAPLVLASSSSTYMKQLPMLQRIASALGELPVRGVMTTGPAIDPADVTAPDNVTVVRSAPHNKGVAPRRSRRHARRARHGRQGAGGRRARGRDAARPRPAGRRRPTRRRRRRAAAAPVREAQVIAAAVRRVIAEPALRAGSCTTVWLSRCARTTTASSAPNALPGSKSSNTQTHGAGGRFAARPIRARFPPAALERAGHAGPATAHR